MSYFKISLLTPQITHGRMQYLESTISEFFNQSYEFNSINDQEKAEDVFANSNISSFCYTFNEKFEIHKNAQKQLTFSITKYIFINDEWLLNPFASALHIGTQLLLTDKDKNEHFFTIKNISFALGLTNITYNITCQDSFSYQTITQNDGYTIENDPSSENFIGARDIDYWVENHIAHDCYIGYDYLPLGTGLYLDNNDNVRLYKYGEQISSLQKIIKEPYSPTTHSEYFETFPFAISGSNASAALIALGEEIGLMLNTYEKKVKGTNLFKKYYWFEPTRNEHITGLTYSPYRDVQNFDFSFGGESLVTVLNIEAQANANEELITLIPTLPEFFMNIIQTTDFWDNSYYSSNFFSSLCKNKTLLITKDLQEDFTVVNTQYYDGWLDLTIEVTIPIGYSFVNFEVDNEQSYLLIDDIYLNPKNSVWSFYKQDGSELIGTEEHALTNAEWNKSGTYKIRIQSNKIKPTSIINTYKLYLNFYRTVTKEEKDFAEMADKCPWLENKIIDFSYFYNQNIINRQEYQELMSLISNDLRIVNGKLLLYSNEYNNALKSKIAAVSNITNDLDSVGAAFQADVIDVYSSKGVVDDISYFDNAYNTVFGCKYNVSNKTPILDYENLLTQYGNKYFDSRQRFLKNIYKFRNYFNSPMNWGSADAAITKYSIMLNNSAYPHKLQFKNNNFQLITTENNTIPDTIYDSNYAEYKNPIVTSDNYAQFYTPKIQKGDFIFIDKAKYDAKKKYYRVAYEFETQIEDNNYILYKEKDNKYYYVPLAAAQSLSPATGPITIGGAIGKRVYLPVTLTEIISDYVYYKKDQYCYHAETDYSPVTNFLKQEEIFNYQDNTGLFSFVSDNIVSYSLDIDLDLDEGDDNLTNYWGYTYYQKLFPLNTLYYYGPKFDDRGKRLNSKNLTVEQYNESHEGEDPLEYQCYQEFSIVNRDNIYTFFRRKKRGSKNIWDLTSEVKYNFEGEKASPNDNTNGLEIFYSKIDKGLDYYNELDHTEKYLYNYYDIIGLTYANIVSAGVSGRSNYTLSKSDLEHLFYKDSYLNIRHSNDIISSLNTYRILYLDKYTVRDGKTAEFVNKFNGRFSKIIYYPIYDASEEIGLAKYNGQKLIAALKDVIGEDTKETNNYFTSRGKKFLIFKEEPYNLETIALNADKSNRFTLGSKQVFDSITDLKIQFGSFDDLTRGFYISAEEVSDFELAKSFNEDTIYYKKNKDNTFIRLYTINQLKASNSFYISNNILANQTQLNKNLSTFNYEMVTDDGKNAGLLSLIGGEYNSNNQATGTISTIIDDIEYSSNFTITQTIGQEINNLTKGQFWYKYHSLTEWPIIFEEAACIETELTTYWTQAVNASKYCEFFLPDNWQPNENGNTNYFKDGLYKIADQTIELLSDYIPEVTIYEQDGKTILPKYDFRYRKLNEIGTNAKILADMDPIVQSFKTINESLNNWIAEENGTTTYYNYIGGGMKWVDLLSKIKPIYSIYTRFSGLYIMTYDLLKNYYLSRNTVRYDEALDKHNAIWKQIYTNYQGLLLEGTYANNNATTSQELYTLASYYMKDITQPEKGYNITIIDINSLEGYIGQELKIGSSIQINTNEYYDDYDDVAKAISQPLFITDISYELRKDSDIQLTVNIVKYQDKLIQRLVKLIK